MADYYSDSDVYLLINELSTEERKSFFYELSENANNYFFVVETELTPIPKTFLLEIIKLLNLNKDLIIEIDNSKVGYFSFYKEVSSNKKIEDAYSNNLLSKKYNMDKLKDKMKIKEHHYIIVESIKTSKKSYLLFKTSGITLKEQINKILGTGYEKGKFLEPSSLLTKAYGYLEFLNKSDDKNKNVTFIKSLETTFPFSYNTKIFYIKSGLRDVDNKLSDLTDLKKIIRNGFISGITIGDNQFSFISNSFSTFFKSMYEKGKKLYQDIKIQDFIDGILESNFDDYNTLDKMFFPYTNFKISETPLNITIESEEDGDNFTLLFNKYEYKVLDIQLGYAKVEKQKNVFILEDYINIKEIFKKWYDNNSDNKDIATIRNLKPIITRNIKKEKIKYIHYDNYSEDSNEDNDIDESEFANISDLYFICKNKLTPEDESIYCIKFQNENNYFVYKYNLDYKLENIINKLGKISDIKDYCEIFLDKLDYLECDFSLTAGNKFKDNKDKLESLSGCIYSSISNNEDLITSYISKEKPKNGCHKKYIFSGKRGGKTHEIADMISYAENSLDLYHFKLKPFYSTDFSGNPGYTNINSVIGEVLQKTFFINNQSKYSGKNDFTGKDEILNFIKQKSDKKEFCIYVNENIRSLFIIKKENKKIVKIGESEKNKEKRKNIWMQYLYIKNILENDINNLSFEGGEIVSALKIIFLIDKNIYKEIFGEDVNKEYLLISFDIGKFINDMK